MRIVLTIIFLTIATEAATDESRAHIKCFANLSYHLFNEDFRKKYPELEKDRQRHLELGVEAGKREFQYGDYKFGIEFFLGGYVERVYSGQISKLQCDDPNLFLDYCANWVTHDTDTLSKIGLKFYNRENCRLLLD